MGSRGRKGDGTRLKMCNTHRGPITCFVFVIGYRDLQGERHGLRSRRRVPRITSHLRVLRPLIELPSPCPPLPSYLVPK